MVGEVSPLIPDRVEHGFSKMFSTFHLIHLIGMKPFRQFEVDLTSILQPNDHVWELSVGLVNVDDSGSETRMSGHERVDHSSFLGSLLGDTDRHRLEYIRETQREARSLAPPAQMGLG